MNLCNFALLFPEQMVEEIVLKGVLTSSMMLVHKRGYNEGGTMSI